MLYMQKSVSELLVETIFILGIVALMTTSFVQMAIVFQDINSLLHYGFYTCVCFVFASGFFFIFSIFFTGFVQKKMKDAPAPALGRWRKVKSQIKKECFRALISSEKVIFNRTFSASWYPRANVRSANKNFRLYSKEHPVELSPDSLVLAQREIRNVLKNELNIMEFWAFSLSNSSLVIDLGEIKSMHHLMELLAAD